MTYPGQTVLCPVVTMGLPIVRRVQSSIVESPYVPLTDARQVPRYVASPFECLLTPVRQLTLLQAAVLEGSQFCQLVFGRECA